MNTNEVMLYLWGLPGPRMAYHTGSREICPNAVSEDSDDDYVVFGTDDTFMKLLEDGFKPSTECSYDSAEGFTALRRDHLNVVFTKDRFFYHRFVKATRLAKFLNLTDKKHRIAVFKAVLYDQFPVG